MLANTNITYTQVVTNNGPSAAASVTLTDVLPANTSAVSLTGPGGWTCTLATLICTNASLAPGAPATITFVVKVTNGTAAGTAINETVNVTTTTADPVLTNNSATASDVVALATQADLITTNSASPTLVAAGSNVTYTQTVTNNGPAVTTAGMTITQTTPPNTNFQSMTPPAGWTCGTLPPVGGTGTITCTDSGTLAVNGTATFTLCIAGQCRNNVGNQHHRHRHRNRGQHRTRHYHEYRQRNRRGRQRQQCRRGNREDWLAQPGDSGNSAHLHFDDHQ